MLSNEMKSSLKNKCVVITGGARGIGFSIAKELLDYGAKVVICSRTKSQLKKTLKILNEKHGICYGKICDVSKLSDCKKLINFALLKLGKIDVLVNNAGIYGPIGPFQNLDLTEFKKTIGINLLGMVNCSYLVIPLMEKAGGGKIINLCGAGVGGGKTMPRFAAYYTSKFAVAGFSEVLADELSRKNIQVNSISPGAVNTYLNDYLIKKGPNKSGIEYYKWALKQKRKGGTPPELAAMLVAYLSSEESNHITGRLLSAIWNSPEKLIRIRKFEDSLYKLRKIDQELFYEKK